MSSVEDRVVAMKFDNNAFERAVATTLSTLQKLKNAVQFPLGAKGLDDLGKSAKNVDLNHVSQGADTASSRLSAMGVVGVTALATIAHKAVETGLGIAKAFTIGPIGSGFDDYNAKLTSVQTVVNATGKSTEEVGKYFNELDGYADKTVFQLSDMTGALSKFVNAGIDLDTAIPAIQGIGNMTAFAGQGAESAAIAYYNLSQSLAGGFMTRTDFKSLELANVATKTFKDEMINAAVAAGELKRNADGTYTILTNGANKTMKANELFIDGLQEGWASNEAILGTMKKFADGTTDLGKKAWSAAQDVKSLPMMMDTLKAAVGTSWTDTFEIILGDLDESKELFTGLTNTIGGFLGKMGDARNEMLRTWKEAGGRTDLIEALKNVFIGLGSVLKPIGQAFRDVFPAMTGERLAELTKNFREFTEGLKVSEGTAENIRKVFHAVFAVFKLGISIISGLVQYLWALVPLAGHLVPGILSLVGAVADLIGRFAEWIDQSGAIQKVFSAIIDGREKALGPLLDWLSDMMVLLGELASSGADAAIAALVAGFNILAPLVKDAGDGIEKAFKSFDGGFDGIGKALKEASSGLTAVKDAATPGISAGEAVSDAWGKVKDIFAAIGSFLAPVGDFIGRIFNSIKEKVQSISGEDLMKGLGTGVLVGINVMFLQFIRSFGGVMASLRGVLQSAGGVLDQVTNNLKTMQNSVRADIILKIAGSVAILAAALWVLSTIPAAQLGMALGAVTALMTGLVVALKVLQKTFEESELKDTANIVILGIGLTALAAALMMFAIAIKMYSEMDPKTLIDGGLAVAACLGSIIIAIKAIEKTGGAKSFLIAAAAIGILSISLMLFATAIKLFSALDTATLIEGGLKLGAVLFGLNLMMQMMSKSGGGKSMLAMAAAIGALAISLGLLIPVILALGNMSWGTIGKGLAAIAATLTILGIAGYFAGPAILALGGGMALLGLGIAAIGLGLVLIAAGLTALGAAGVAGAAAAVSAISLIATTIPIIMEQIGIGIRAFAEEIGKSGAEMVAAFTTILDAILQAIINSLPKIGELFTQLVRTGLRVIRDLFPEVLNTGLYLLLRFLDGIGNNIYRIVDRAVRLAREFMRAIGDQAGPLADSAAKMIIKFVNGVSAAIDNHSRELGEAGGRLASAIVRGMVNGITGGVGEIGKAARGLAKQALSAVGDFLGIASPSKEFAKLGMWSAVGMAQGIAANAGAPARAAVAVAQRTIDVVRDKMAELAGMDSTIRPVIAPVLDLSDYRRNASTLQSAFTNPQISADISTQNASTISNLDEARLAAQVPAAPAVTQEIKLEQNNYSPKALDPIEIYRNTKSLLALEKEAS